MFLTIGWQHLDLWINSYFGFLGREWITIGTWSFSLWDVLTGAVVLSISGVFIGKLMAIAKDWR